MSKTYRDKVNNTRVQLAYGRVYERGVFLDRPWTWKSKHTDTICLRRNKKQKKNRNKYFVTDPRSMQDFGKGRTTNPTAENLREKTLRIGGFRSVYDDRNIYSNLYYRTSAV